MSTHTLIPAPRLGSAHLWRNPVTHPRESPGYAQSGGKGTGGAPGGGLHGGDSPFGEHFWYPHLARGALHVALVPQREREQPPQLARQVLAARDVGVEDGRDGFGAEEPLPG